MESLSFTFMMCFSFGAFAAFTPGETANSSLNPPTNPVMSARSGVSVTPTNATPTSPITKIAPGSTTQLQQIQVHTPATGTYVPFNYNPSRVQVSSQNGILILQGTVDTPAEANALLQNARAANEGSQVINNLRVENTAN